MFKIRTLRTGILSVVRFRVWLHAGFALLNYYVNSLCPAIGRWTSGRHLHAFRHFVCVLTVSAIATLHYAHANAETTEQKPEVSISAVEKTATEGAVILFKISAIPEPNKEISLEFNAELSGDFGVVYNPNAILTPESSSAFIVVLTKDDNREESNGSVTLSIIPPSDSSDYQIAPPPNNSAKVEILDNDRVDTSIATLSVRAESDYVEEGGTARFVFYSSKPVSEPIVVNVAHEGNFLNDYYECYTIEMVEGESTARLNIITVNDRVFENNGKVTVALEPSKHFRLSKTRSSASVLIIDNDQKESLSKKLKNTVAHSSGTIPEISIEAVSTGTLQEGELGEFRISASQAPTKDLPIYVSAYEVDSNIYRGKEINLVTLPTLVKSMPFALETTDDNLAGGEGQIVLSVLPGSGYTVGSTSKISVQTADNDIGSVADADNKDLESGAIPQLTFSNFGRDSLSEGQTAHFAIESSLPPDTDLDVNLFISDGDGEFLRHDIPASISFPSQQKLLLLDLPTVDDNVVEPNGSVIVALVSGKGYRLGSEIGESVEILDNDKTTTNNSIFGCGEKVDSVAEGPVPVIEIDAVPFSQIGSITQFRIQASVTVETDMSVNLDLSGGDATGELNFSFSVPLIKGEQVTTFFFPTVEGSAGNSSNSKKLSASVATGSRYNVSENNETATTELVQFGSSTPVLSIRATSDSITEGESAEFLLESSVAPSSQMEVLIEFKQKYGGLNYESFVESFLFPRGRRALAVILDTEIDDRNFGDGELVATVLVGRNYRTARSPGNVSRIRVKNDGISVVTLSNMQESGNEGSRFEFDFSVYPIPESQLTVVLDVSQRGNFLKDSSSSEELALGRSTLVFRPNVSTIRMYAATEDDSDMEPDGSIEVSVLSGSNYRASLNTEAASVIVYDNDAPRMSLVSKTETSKTEGEHLEFEILASRASPTNLQINFDVTEEGSSYAIQDTETTRTLPTNGEKLTFTIPTEDDEVDEEDNLVTVSLLSGTGYNVATSDYYASVYVVDNDDPRQITIESAFESVNEGDPAIFYIRANGEIHREIEISVDSGNSDFLIDNPPTSVLVKGTKPVALSLPTDDDDVDEPDAFVFASILSGENYIVDEETGNASILVLDNDEPPLISIEASSEDEILEGEAAKFVITSSHEAYRTINLNVSDGGSGILVEQEPTLRIELDGQKSRLVSFATINDDRYQPNNRITAAILSSEDYVVADSPDNIAFINVQEDDLQSAYSIVAVERTIDEGSTARFRIESRGLAGVEVPIEVIEEGEFVRGQLPTTVRIAEHGFTHVEIVTDNDKQDEADGSITARLNLNNVSILRGGNLATVNILDNDTPEISLRASQSFVELGNSINFTAISTTPPARNLKLRLKISDIGETFEQEKYVSLSIPAGQTVSNKALYIAARNDVFQFNRRIVAELVSNARYKIKGSSGKSIIHVVGSETPEISIETISDASKIEGSAFDFRLNSSISISRPLRIKLELTSEGNYLTADSDRTVVMAADESQVDFEVRSVDNGRNVGDGSITVTVQSAPGYDLSSDKSKRNATVEVIENIIPMISIEAVLDEVTEGDPAQFILTADPPLTQRTSVIVAISESGDFLSDAEGNIEVLMESGSAKTTFRVGTSSDNVVEGNGQITATIQENDGYVVPQSTGKSANVIVIDNSAIQPSISISVENSVTSVYEGSTVQFNIRASRVPGQSLEINVQINQSGNYLTNGSESRTLDLPQNTLTTSFSVNTVDDNIAEPNGSISATIVSGVNYTIGNSPDNSATVTVLDNDIPTIAFGNVSTEVEEGDPILIEFTSSVQTESDLMVSIEVTDNSRAIGNADSVTRTITLVSGTRSISETIDTLDNRIDEGDRAVLIEIQDGTGYQVSSLSDRNITITVTDNDLPVLSISAIEEFVEEGSPARFSVSADIEIRKTLSMRYSVTQTGDVLIDTTRNNTVIFASSLQSATIQILTVQDEIDEEIGTITLTIEQGNIVPAQYDIASDVNSRRATVNVMDDDVPEISISPRTAGVEKGEPIQFTLSSNINHTFDLNIKVFVGGDSGFINSSDMGEKTWKLTANSQSMMFEVATLSGQQANSNGDISIELRAGEGYTVADSPANSSNFAILDQDLLTMHIVALDSAKNEGDQVRFELVSSKTNVGTKTVNMRLTESKTHPVSGKTTSTTINLFQVFPTNQSKVEISRSTSHDRVHNSGSTLSLQIMSGTGYEVDPVRFSASAIVRNIDIPEFSVKPKNLNGNSGSFNVDTQTVLLESTIDLGVPLNVGFEISVTDSSTGATTDTQFSFLAEPANDNTYEVAIGNRYSALNGDTVAITLQSGTGYILSSERQVSFTLASSGPARLAQSYETAPTRSAKNSSRMELTLANALLPRYSDNILSYVETEINRQDGNLPIVSISANTREVKEKETARFTISATKAPATNLTVNLAIDQQGGEFIAGPSPQFQILDAGKTFAVLEIEIIDDNVEQNTRTLTVEIKGGQGYGIAAAPNDIDSVDVLDDEFEERINRTQELNSAIIPNSLAAMGTSIADSLSQRFEQAYNNEINDSPSFQMGGGNSILDVLQYQTQQLGDSTNTWASLLEESTVKYTMFSDSDLFMPISIWGNSDYYFKTEDVDDDSMSQDGEVYNLYLGFDAHHQTGIIAGASVNQFVSDLEYRGGTDDSITGSHQNFLTGVHPYVGWVSQLRNMKIWSSAGFGQGNVTIKELENEQNRLQSAYQMYSLNSENHFLNLEDFFGGGVDIGLRNEAWRLRQEIDSNSIGMGSKIHDSFRVRSAIEGSHQMEISPETTLQTDTRVGVHVQGGTAGDYFRFELGGDFSSVIPYGFSVDGHAQLYFGSSITFDQQILNGNLHYDQDNDDLELLIDLASSIGETDRGSESASERWQIAISESIWHSASPWENKQFEVRFAYGIQILDELGITTPYHKFVLRNQGRHEFRIGNDLTAGENFSTSIEAFVSLYEEKDDFGVTNRYSYSW